MVRSVVVQHAANNLAGYTQARSLDLTIVMQHLLNQLISWSAVSLRIFAMATICRMPGEATSSRSALKLNSISVPIRGFGLFGADGE